MEIVKQEDLYIYHRGLPKTIISTYPQDLRMTFIEIDDDLWSLIHPLFPPQKPPTGRPRADERGLINGILYVLSTGCSWTDVPRQYGTKSTTHWFHLLLSTQGRYDQIFALIRNQGYDISQLDLSCCSIDTTTIPGKRWDC